MILVETLRRANSHLAHGIHGIAHPTPRMKGKYIKANVYTNDFIICLFILSTLSVEYLSYIR